MDNWNKIDLHQHTLNEITYDGKSYESLYTHEKFEKVLLEEKVKLKAVTNHNTLNLVDHIKHALICKKNNIAYLPGVEIDYQFNDKTIHAISVLNPEMDLIPFSSKLSKYIQGKTDKKYLDRNEFAEVHENIEYIFIPHVMKTKGIYPSADKPSVEDAENWVFSMIKNGMFVPVIFENTQNYHKYSVFSKIDEIIGDKNEYPACYVGSDYKFDDDEKRRKKAIEKVKYYIDALPTYRGLEIAIRNHTTRIAHESELISRTKYIKSIEFNDNNNFNSKMSLQFSPSLNVIIGGSGSGKTLLLNEIYRVFKNEDLKSVNNAQTKKTNKKAYFSKTGNSPLFMMETEPADYSSFKVIEIPNIYTEIMKYITDTKQLAEVFNISNRTYVQTIINSFKTECLNYCNLLDDLSEAKSDGEENLRNIITSIDFLSKNKSNDSVFTLKAKSMKSLESEKTKGLIDKNIELIGEKDNIIEYFEKIDVALGGEYSELVNDIVEKYNVLLAKLEKKNDVLGKIKLEQNIKEQIEILINGAIRNSNSKLGLKDKAIKEREETRSNNVADIVSNIKKALIAKKEIDSTILMYPYEKIKETIEKNNANELARFTLSFDVNELRSVQTDDENFFEVQNIKTKLRNMPVKTIDFLNDKSIKEFVSSARKAEIDIDTLIKNDPSVSLELNVDGAWKPATSVNQGTIAKVSMEYYFNSIINNERPDIIFIDQPENDVDKEFLTSTLARFLIDKKTTAQIFITSHDPILTVNADANMIIQADVDENNKISYLSYPLEYSEGNSKKSDEVARILDGGKRNIEKRYQIYGGILKYGD